VDYAPLPGELAVVVCESGVRHELTGGEYNERRQNCESAARKLGARSLRAVEPKYLAANKSKLSQREYECAYHVVGEIQRVAHGERALREGDFVQFGQYMFQSHESSRDFFKNSCPELDLLVAIAKQTTGCLGSRLTGGGFGGATINLVERGKLDQFNLAIAAQYQTGTGRSTTPLACQIVDGARSCSPADRC
jgi:galactokinase